MEKYTNTPEGDFKESFYNLQTNDIIFNKHFDLNGLNIIKAELLDKGAGQYDPREKTIKISSKGLFIISSVTKLILLFVPSIHLNKALQKIHNRQLLNEHEIYGFHTFVHEHTHHLQSILTFTDELGEITNKIFEGFTEIVARERTIDFLEEVYKGIENNLDFREIINNSFAYPNEVERLNNFIKEINDPEIIDLFTTETRKKGFNPHNSKELLLALLNRNGEKFVIDDIDKIFE